MTRISLKIFVATLALILSVYAKAGVERATTLCVVNAVGEEMTFPLSENPKMTFKGTYVVIQTNEVKLLRFKDLVRAYFTEEDPDGFTAPTVGETVTTDNDVIGFNHFKPLTRVFVYTASGSLAKVAQTDTEGKLRLSIGNLPHGLYVIKAGNSSVKLSK